MVEWLVKWESDGNVYRIFNRQLCSSYQFGFQMLIKSLLIYNTWFGVINKPVNATNCLGTSILQNLLIQINTNCWVFVPCVVEHST